MRYLLILLLLGFTSSAYAKMYRWVDDHGKVHYSDQAPSDDAEAYEPPPILTVPAKNPGGLIPLKKSTAPVKYKAFAINVPSNDHVFTPDKTESISVSAQLEPGLQAAAGHRIDFYVDGQLHSKSNQTSWTLKDLSRGTHTVSAKVVDKKGKTHVSTESISFHIQKHHL